MYVYVCVCVCPVSLLSIDIGSAHRKWVSSKGLFVSTKWGSSKPVCLNQVHRRLDSWNKFGLKPFHLSRTQSRTLSVRILSYWKTG